MAKVVVVTGASGGMGAATVREFKANGFIAIGFDRNGDGGECDHFFRGDILDEGKWSEVAALIGEKYGHLDALVNVAGRNYLANIDLAELDQWRNMFEVNVIGMVASIKHLKALLDKGDSPAIVNMSSISSNMGSIGYAAYCATKGAVNSFTKSLALELAPKIRVNAIAPGWIETPFTVEGLEKSPDPVQYRREVEAMHALGRVGSPDEIARTIYWMCSTSASFMTGSIVTVDGGYLINNT